MRLTSLLLSYNTKHRQFFARTIMVKDNVDHAFRTLNRMMAQEDILKELRLRRYREKPYQTRNRISYEICKAIYNDDMKRKIDFLLRRNKLHAWASRSPGSDPESEVPMWLINKVDFRLQDLCLPNRLPLHLLTSQNHDAETIESCCEKALGKTESKTTP